MITQFKLYDNKKEILDKLKTILKMQYYSIGAEFTIDVNLRITDEIKYLDLGRVYSISYYNVHCIDSRNNSFLGELENLKTEDLKLITKRLLYFIQDTIYMFGNKIPTDKIKNENDYNDYLKYVDIVNNFKPELINIKIPKNYNDYLKEIQVKRFNI